MSLFWKKLFQSSSSQNKENNSPLNGDNERRLARTVNQDKQRKLMRYLALAQNDPDPLIDLSDYDLVKVDEQILSLVKVYRKTRVHLERNLLPSFSIHSAHFNHLTVLHLEDNRIVHFHLESASLLPSLKELYLNSNQLNSVPCSLFDLPRLTVLSLRQNRLADFPLGILALPALTYCDLAYNQIGCLPSQLCTFSCEASKLVQLSQSIDPTVASAPSLPFSLQSLLLEGNPLETPSYKYLHANCQDVTDLVQIKTCLRQFYNLTQVENAEKLDCDLISQHTSQSSRKNCQLGDDDFLSKQTENSNSIYDNQDADCFSRYEQKKLETKQHKIEWERNYLNRHLEQKTLEAKQAKVTCKDKLLEELYSEQGDIFEKINRFIYRKDVEKQKILDSYVVQLQEHSSTLIEKLSHDTSLADDKSAYIGNYEQANLFDEELNRDLDRLLNEYEIKMQLKRNVLLDKIEASTEQEYYKLNESFQRKDNLHLSLYKDLQTQEENLSQTFESLLNARDRHNKDLADKIALVEQELLALTLVERERKDIRNDQLLGQLDEQRTRLAELLANLLEVKRQREKHLKETMEKELCRRFEGNDSRANSWLHEFQTLLAKEPFENQTREYGIDIRVADILIELYRELENVQHGTMFQNKLVYYLPCFVDRSLEYLYSCSAEDFMKCTIDDYELCKIIESKLKQVYQQHALVDSIRDDSSCPTYEELCPEECASAPAMDERSDESGKTWRESECVICLLEKSSVVFLPCGHICTCKNCIRPNACPLSLCPLCRADIHYMQSIEINR